jgi:glycosyltransferase involved in cell wall biosynthesis
VRPTVSIITTVYDRVVCLRRCVASVKKLTMPNVEHIVVADDPPSEALVDIATLCADNDVALYSTPFRTNDWGNSPASLGLSYATGEYVCFLSDDNAYLPDHFEPLVAALDSDRGLGMVYSSCLYAGTRELRLAPPMGAGIDLGQPLWRRSVLREHFIDDRLPFNGVFSWDWEMIRALVYERGVRWAHVDRATFIFRLEAYPPLVEALR